MILYALLIIFFAYFYTQVTLNPMEISKNIRENGGSIPGIRSEKMEEYLTQDPQPDHPARARCSWRFIALIPTVVQNLFKFPRRAGLAHGRHVAADPGRRGPGHDVPDRRPPARCTTTRASCAKGTDPRRGTCS